MSRHCRPLPHISPKNAIPKAPTHLPPVAKRLYRTLAEDLADNVSSLDVGALAAYCQCYARWIEAEKIINEQGIQPNGKLTPANKVAQEMMKLMRAYGGELGLSPLARGRVRAEPVEVVDPLETFLEGGP